MQNHEKSTKLPNPEAQDLWRGDLGHPIKTDYIHMKGHGEWCTNIYHRQEDNTYWSISYLLEEKPGMWGQSRAFRDTRSKPYQVHPVNTTVPCHCLRFSDVEYD